MQPRARTEQLLVRQVADELVVYDQERDRAHRLSRRISSRTGLAHARRHSDEPVLARLATG